MNQFKLSQIVQQIEEQTTGDIGGQKILRDLIDSQYEHFTVFYTKAMFGFYTTFYFIPFIVQTINGSEQLVLVCRISCCCVQTLLFGIEIIKIKQSTFSKYIEYTWNKLDICNILLNLVYFISKFITEANDREEKGFFSIKNMFYNEDAGKEKGFETILINLVIITFACVKLISYVRIYESFDQLIQLLSICTKDISTFVVCFISWIVFFGSLYSILGVEFDAGDYSQLNMIEIIGIQTYRN